MDQKEIMLTPLQGYISVYRFLYLQNESLKIQSIKDFLKVMKIGPGGHTIDPDIRDVWLQILTECDLGITVDVNSAEQIFHAMKSLFMQYSPKFQGLEIILKNFQRTSELYFESNNYWQEWLVCVNQTLQDIEVPDLCWEPKKTILQVFPPRSDQQISFLQAFNAMRKFLERYYQETSSDQVGSLLGELEFLADGNTADPAAWHDWLKAVDKAIEEKEIPLMQLKK